MRSASRIAGRSRVEAAIPRSGVLRSALPGDTSSGDPEDSLPTFARNSQRARWLSRTAGQTKDAVPRLTAAPQVTVVNERVLGRREIAPFLVLAGASIGALGYFVYYWFFGESRSLENPLLWLTAALFFPGVIFYVLRFLALPWMVRPRKLRPTDGLSVAAVTTFVPEAEPLEMLEEIVRALVAMEYPHDTWVLDEGDSPAVKALCDRLGALHFSRKNRPEYQTAEGRLRSRTKHGNYNAWLDDVGFDAYDFVASFDPDHIPDARYLVEMLGYFGDPSIGYVQAAQVYYNQGASFIARGAAEETYAYYSSLMMSAYANRCPIVTGCHTIHRTAALKQVGGFAPHDADDLLITLLYRVARWQGIYVPRRLAIGLTPVDWSGYLNQQRRWARSVLDIKLRVYPKLARSLPLRERMIAFVHGLYYLHGLAVAIGLGVFAFVLITGDAPITPGPSLIARLCLLWIVLQLCDFYRQRFYLHPRQERGVHWRGAFLRFAKWPYVALALVEALFSRERGYAITLKVKQKRAFATLPHVLTLVVLASAWIIGAWRHGIHNHVIDALAVAVAAISAAVILTEFLDSPSPFDRSMAREAIDRFLVDHETASDAAIVEMRPLQQSRPTTPKSAQAG
jgi:cellulose synthase/poly-beta-1,6-N-acetylglucosamine synthase-like glycosyltransferase